MANPYATLGVAKTASAAEIKSAYRKLAKQLHPDRNTDNPKAAERFATVTGAYDLLSDPDKRAKFDRGEIDADGNPAMPFGFGGGAGGAPGGGFRGFRGDPRGGFSTDFGGGAEAADLGSLFEELLGAQTGRGRGAGMGAGMGGGFGRSAPPARGANIAYRLTVPFIDAATRATQRITLADGGTVDLKLPAGVTTGTQMRLAGKGQAGPGGAGDGIVTLTVADHPFFTRDGDDVRLDLPVTLVEAVAGARIRVPTVDGPVMLQVPKGASSGRTLRLKGKGFSRKGGGADARGDQLVTIQVDLPPDDEALARFVADWRDDRDVRQRLGV